MICFRVRSLNFDFRMAMHEACFSLEENSNRMVTVTPFMGKLKVHIRQFYIDGNGEMKPGKNGTTLEIEEFYELVELIPQIKTSIEMYELKDTGILSSPFAVSQAEPIFPNLPPPVFLPSPPSQEPIPVTGDDELLYDQPKCPSPSSSLLNLPPLWKIFCLILVQKKNSGDIIKTLLLMNICSDQQSMKNQLFSNVTTQ